MNVRKHAGAGLVTVSLTRDATTIALAVADDGCGFDTEDAHLLKRGLGLPGMLERTELLDGRLTLSSQLGAGVQIVAGISLS